MNTPLNILLAEDERSVAFSISFALKADGHRIEIVNDGEEAFSEMTRKPGPFDLLITDHSMPRMNGVELVKRLRDTAFPGRIVVLSARLSAENRAAYIALDVDLMVPKPFDVHELRAALGGWLEARGWKAGRGPCRLRKSINCCSWDCRKGPRHRSRGTHPPTGQEDLKLFWGEQPGGASCAAGHLFLLTGSPSWARGPAPWEA